MFLHEITSSNHLTPYFCYLSIRHHIAFLREAVLLVRLEQLLLRKNLQSGIQIEGALLYKQFFCEAVSSFRLILLSFAKHFHQFSTSLIITTTLVCG